MNIYNLNIIFKTVIMNSFNNLIQTHINSPQPNYTPAEIPHVNNMKDEFNAAVQNGLEPTKIVKMLSIMTLIVERGITVDDLQRHNQLFVQLCMDSDFSIMDYNINHIFNQMNLARNAV